MNYINKLQEKLSLSSKEITNTTYEFDEEDVINYFEIMVNEKKHIHFPRFELEITNKTDHEDKIICYYPEENKFIFNIGLLIFESKQLDVYSINLKCLEIINRIVAHTELLKMIDDSMISYTDPVFYSLIVEELLKNDGYLMKNYINFRSLQLTDLFVRKAAEKYPFRELINMYHIKDFNEYILSYYNEDYQYCPLLQAIEEEDNFKIVDEGTIEIDYSSDVLYRFGKKVYNNYVTARNKTQDLGNESLLNSLLFGKPIDKEKYPDLNILANKISLFEYAESQDELHRNQIINKI